MEQPSCCAQYHRAVELVGRRWSGAILAVLIEHEPLRFGEIGAAVPGLSDRMLAERARELERHGLVTKTDSGSYALNEAGRDLEPAVRELHVWAHRWIAHR
jgi:DNA-binding HxlR family transcriptional regulator